MKKLLLIAICFLSVQLSVFHSLAQVAIIGTTWSGSGLSTATASDPSTFTTLPATALPGAAAVAVTQWNRNNLQGTVTTTATCYNTNDWDTGVTSSFATSVANAKYIYFTVTNDANTELEITNVFLNSQVSAQGPQNVSLQYAVGAGADASFGTTLPTLHSASAETFSFTGVAHICAGQTATFKLYGWGGGNPSGTLRLTDGTSMTATFVQPRVTTLPDNNASFIAICAGTALSLTSNPTPGIAPFTFSWTGPLGFTSTLQDPSIASVTFAEAGVYNVTVTDAYGCMATGTTTANVVMPADTTMTISGPLAFCTPGSVTFSVPDDFTSGYTWYNGASVVGFGNTYTASTSGVYHVEISDGFSFPACVTYSTYYTVTVTTAPTPVITPSGPTTVCTPSTLTLSTGTGTGYTYQWYNASGAISGETNNVFTPTASGTYHVTVVNGSCTGTSTNTTVTINTSPVAPVVTPTGPVTICSNSSPVTLTSTTQTGVTYRWWRSPASIPGATNSTYGVAISGTYSMVVTNTANACTATSNGVVVTINPTPSTGFTVNPTSGVICSGSPATLTLTTVVPGSTYQWLLNDNPVAGATNSTYSTTTIGTYRLIVTRTATGCFDTSTAPGTVLTAATSPTVGSATISPGGPFTICSNDSVSLSVPVGTGLTYQWHRAPSTTIPGATNRTYVVHATGNYSVVVTNAGGCSTNSPTTVSVTVNTAPSAAVTTSGSTTFCTGGNVAITAATVAGYTYQWYDASGAIAGEVNNTYTATTSGTYHAVVTSSNGCITTTVSTTVNVIATPVINTTGPASFCTGGLVTLTVSTSGTPGISYQWYRDGVAIPGAVAASYSATTAGVYTCFVNIPGSCAVTTASVTVTVFAAVIPVISFDGVYVSTYNTYATYQWYINTVIIPGATSYRYAAPTNAGYRVSVTDINGCQLLSPTFSLFNLAVDNVNAQNTVSIYPNPATSTVHIAAAQEVNVTIATIEGKIMMQGTSKDDIDVSHLANGLYMIMAYDKLGNRVHVEKLVKQ